MEPPPQPGVPEEAFLPDGRSTPTEPERSEPEPVAAGQLGLF
jgi:hypothetical protein